MYQAILSNISVINSTAAGALGKKQERLLK